jgi:hypothetical protein
MGAPLGNTNRARQYRVQRTIEGVLRKRSVSDDLEALEQLIEAQVVKASEGDLASFKELMDRYAGKAPQGIELTGEDGGPVMHSAVDWNIVAPKD